MKFTTRCPSTWKELQDDVSLYLNQAGYQAISPCTIETVRGKVEVDVLVHSPEEPMKKIVCECKFWNSPVPKEKVHAFRTVVHDSGASMGFLISKVGFQSGAIEAAKFSNVKLLTWDEFNDLIADKWIISQLKQIKHNSVPLSEYLNPLHFPYEELDEGDKERYLSACRKYMDLRYTCWLISKSDLKDEKCSSANWYQISKYSCIDSYLNFLSTQVNIALQEFREILISSNITISSDRLDKLDGYTYLFLN